MHLATKTTKWERLECQTQNRKRQIKIMVKGRERQVKSVMVHGPYV